MMMSVSRENPKALYLQVADALKQDIIDGTFKPGDRIGSQEQLVKRFKVSKITIRKAIEILETEGYVTISHGIGTFVKQEKVEQTLGELQSLTDIIKGSGFNPEVKVIKMYKKTLETSNENLDKQIEVLAIERIHSIEKKPIALARAYIPWEIGQQLKSIELENNTIYELLENKLNITLSHGEQSIEACPANEELSKVLDVKVGTPLLKASRLTFDNQENLVEKISFYYRYDVFGFKIKLNRYSITPMWPTKIPKSDA